ncbi:MAG: enoyl-CoA hydratase-related protein, partial [Candidatus Methanofastidiosia archaeon]
ASFDDSVAVIVFTGAGKDAFCTGGDVKEYASIYLRKPRDYWKYMGIFKGYIESIINSGKPVIARLNGMAVGGGNESQLACDLAVMAEHAFISQVGTNVGSVACGGSTQWLSLFVGDRRAREILFLNERIPAFKALEWGLVNQVVHSVKKDEEFVGRATQEEITKARKGEDGHEIDLSLLDKAVDELCGKLIEKFPECMRYTKQQVNFFKDFAWHQTIGHARDWLSIHFTSLEPNEGMSAFVEKRRADYLGIRKKAAEGKSSEFLWGPYKKICQKCGAKGIPEDFEFCGVCGEKL